MEFTRVSFDWLEKGGGPALPLTLAKLSVFGADEDQLKAVMEGDSVTLNPDPAQIQGFIDIEWRFKDNTSPIAYTNGVKPTYSEDEIFRDRLNLNQTGSLTITNIKTKHSGLYHLRMERNSGRLNVDYTVTVSESPSVIDAVKGEMKMESVTEGDHVTLQTDVTELHGDELIVWRFGDEGKLIVKTDIEAKSSPLYTDERLRDRLELDHQTGSLIITNSRITDSGLYRVKISSSKQTLYKRFTVTVSAWNDGTWVDRSCLPDLGQKQAIAMPHCHHSTLHVGQIIMPHVLDVGRIWADNMLLSGL
ncbi:Hemicentin-1 [Labeo rohita]|uniref:Hemicentin-1 n=1 Tax=Labeo rohita TaxID=84645 RepID=A0ABQ8L3X0_LABRO|nr:Hemicentin-1 [Labeo rohita]